MVPSLINSLIFCLQVYNQTNLVYNMGKRVRKMYLSEKDKNIILYHAPWIDNLRQTTLGGLVLGFGFLWSDIFCYTIGIIIGVIKR